MADTKWLEIAVNTTPDKLDEVCAKLAAAGMDGLVIEDEMCIRDRRNLAPE